MHEQYVARTRRQLLLYHYCSEYPAFFMSQCDDNTNVLLCNCEASLHSVPAGSVKELVAQLAGQGLDKVQRTSRNADYSVRQRSFAQGTAVKTTITRGSIMRRHHRLMAALAALILGGCATAFTPPSADQRNSLAPTGTLRAGILLTTSLQVTKDTASGELKGVSVDLGKELARRLGVPFTPVGYTSITALIEGARLGQWDVAYFVVDPSREKDVDYAAPHMEAEVGYLVRPGSNIKTLTDVDAPGIRVAVASKGGPDLFLSSHLKRAELVRGDGVPAAVEMLKSGKADALAANKATMYVEAELIPGSRVLDGRISVVQYGMATAMGRGPGNAYVRKFLEEAKATGFIKSLIERAGLRGVVAAP